jgi:acyloxyacyl hydrolase
MSKAAIGWICLLLVVFIPVIDGGLTGLGNGANGGADCATCSIILGLVDHLTIVYNETAAKSLERICSFLPDPYKGYCKTAFDFLGKFFILIPLI